MVVATSLPPGQLGPGCQIRDGPAGRVQSRPSVHSIDQSNRGQPGLPAPRGRDGVKLPGIIKGEACGVAAARRPAKAAA
jgi:hypothetical protein